MSQAPFRLRLRTILLVVNLLVLLLPLGSIYLLRIYENELIRQTESELYVQGAFIAAAYKQEIKEILAEQRRDPSGYGREVVLPPDDGEYYHPIPALLDLTADPILPPQPEAIPTMISPDPVALDAAAKLEPVIKEAQRTTLAGIRVVDYQGLIVASSGEEKFASLAHTREIRQAFSGAPVSFMRRRILEEGPPPLAAISRGTGIRVFAALPIIQDNRILGAVQLSRTPRNILKALHKKRHYLIAAFSGLVVVALLLAMFTSLTISRPIKALIQRTQLLSSGRTSEITPLKSPMTKEIARLSDAFVRMARAIEHRTGYIQSFAMHVSHEFKTPLTAIQGAVELLDTHLEDMDPAQQKRFLGNIAKDTDRLRRLVTRLLEMARADVFEPTAETSDVMEVLAMTKERYVDEGLELVVSGQEQVHVAASAEVVDLVAGHLLDNSLQHGADRVKATVSQHKGRVRIRFADNGQGVSRANRDKIFTPFFTTGRDSGGTGLGLSIVGSLLTAHEGSVSLVPEQGQGAVFVVELPEAGAEAGAESDS